MDLKIVRKIHHYVALKGKPHPGSSSDGIAS